MTSEQDRAFQVLNDYYGDCRIAESREGEVSDVKLEAVDEDGDVRARWWVRPDGIVPQAWDPDRLLDKYKAGK